MEALLTPFVAALLAEYGDKTMLLAAALAAHYRRPGPIVAGIAVAALVHAGVAAAGGVIVRGLIAPSAAVLLVAVALLYAGVAGLIRPKAPQLGSAGRLGPFLASAGWFFLLELGDKTQFLTFALAARFDSLLLPATGAAAGIVAANLPAVLLGGRFVTVKAARIAVAALFLIAGFILAVTALQLT